MAHWYVGHTDGHLEAFRSSTTPSREAHGARYGAVVGPFRTERGARWAESYGMRNPHFRSVSDAEAIAREMTR